MKKENFERAKEIEGEQKTLNDYLVPILRATENQKIELKVGGSIPGGGYKEDYYGAHLDNCPEFLKETLSFQLSMVCDVIVKKVTDQINQLQKEFDNL